MSEKIPIRPTRAEIDMAALRHNLQTTRRLAAPAKVMGIVKAEAYGHGMVKISQELERAGVEYLGVSFLEEGVTLREAGITSPILVMGGLVDEQVERYFDYELTLTVSSIWKAKQVEAAAEKTGKQARIHLKFDTGIGRVGQNWQTANLLLNEIVRLNRVSLEGIYTHFASSEDVNHSFTKLQLERFHIILDSASKLGLDWKYTHCANSGGIINHPDDSRFNLVRPGLMLYGYPPGWNLLKNVKLQPVMSLKTRVVFIKRPPAGTPIGYGSTWKSPGGHWIATLPIGYGDGFPRRAGNRACVWIHDKPYPIVGNVSMDQITIDAGDAAYLGDEVLLFGSINSTSSELQMLCEAIDAIPYEVLCGLTARVPRLYLNTIDSSLE